MRKPLLFSCDDPGIGGCAKIAFRLLDQIPYGGAKMIATRLSSALPPDLFKAPDASESIKAVDWPISRRDGVMSIHDLRSAARMLEDVDPALLVCHQSQPSGPSLALRRVASAAGIPVIAVTHLVKSDDVEPPAHPPKFRRCADRLVFVCHDNANRYTRQFARRMARQGPETVSVIHNGVSASEGLRPDPVARGVLAAAMLCDPRDFLVVMVARLSLDKGQDIAMRAMAELRTEPSVRLAIVGTGPEAVSAQLRRLARQLGVADRVMLLGQREDARRLMRGADLVLQLGREEGLPLAMLEAMAEGTPVIATRAGGVEEALVGLDTVLPPANDAALASMLARRIGDLANDPSRTKALGQALHARWKEQFTERQMVDRHAELIADVLAEHVAPQGDASRLRLKRLATLAQSLTLPLPFDTRNHVLAGRWPMLGQGWAVIGEEGIVAGLDRDAMLEFPLQARGPKRVRIAVRLRQPKATPFRRLACTLNGRLFSTRTFFSHRSKWLSFDVDVPSDGMISLGIRTISYGLPIRRALGFDDAGANFMVSAITLRAL